MPKKLTTKDFIEKSISLHGDKYDYSKVFYINKDTKVCIICAEHGEFWQTPNNHWKRKGCPKCSKNYKLNIGVITKRCREYNVVLLTSNYKNAYEKMSWRCNVDGCIFVMCWHDIQSGNKCPACSMLSRREKISGENSCMWNPNLTEDDRIHNRILPENKIWIRNIFIRDNYVCQICGKTNTTLNAHHLDGYHWCKEKRYDIENGISLCTDCHKEFHKLFGNKYNTREQFMEFYKYKMFKGGI